MCCLSIAGRIRCKDKANFFVEALCVGVPVVVAIPSHLIESISDLGADNSLLKLSDQFDALNVKIFDKDLKNHFMADFSLVGSEPGVSARIAPAWYIAANALLKEYDGIIQGVSLAVTIGTKLWDFFGPNKTEDELKRIREEIREGFQRMTSFIQGKFDNLELYLENQLFLELRADLNALLIGIQTVETYLGSTNAAEQQQAQSILSSMTTFDGIRIFTRVHAVVVDRLSKYSVRLGADIIMVQIVEILNLAHEFAQTNNKFVVDQAALAHQQLIDDVPLEFADERYTSTTWTSWARDPDTGELISIVRPGFTGPTGSVACRDYTECDKKRRAIVIPNFLSGKGKLMTESTALLHELKLTAPVS